MDAAEEQQGADGADEGAEHVPLAVPDVSLRAQEGVRGLASGDGARTAGRSAENGAAFAFFLILVITGELMGEDGSLTQSVLFYLAVAVPGGLLVFWVATSGRR